MPAVTRNISSQLASSGGAGIADASQIAFSYKEQGGYTVMDKSIKDMLENTIVDSNDIPYSYKEENGETVVDKTIKEQLDTLSQGADSIVQAAADATTAQQAISSMQTAIVNQFNNNISQMDQKKNTFESQVSELSTKLNSVINTAETLQYSFDNGTNFAVMSETAYNGLQNKQDNVIYFLFDENNNQ